MLALRSSRVSVCRSSVARPAAPKAVRMTLVRAEPQVKAATSVPDAIKDAEKACADGSTNECAAAWDVVEEISAATSHKKVIAKENSDPLEQFCDGNPDADECRMHDN